MILPKLAISNFRLHKVRALLTSLAIALSVSLVVAVTSGYASAEGAAHYYLNKYLGSTDAQVTRRGNQPLDESIVTELRGDPDVAVALGRLESEVRLLDRQGRPIPGRGAHAVGVDRPADKGPEKLALVAGGWFHGDSGDVAVIDQVAAEVLSAKVGDAIALAGAAGALRLKVVGIAHKPGILAAHMQTVYLPIRTLQRWAMPGQAPQVTRVQVELKSDTRAAEFRDRWQPRLDARKQGETVRLTRESRRELDKNLQGVRVLSYMGGTISMLAATFIIFSALSMGVAERQRTLAMLRAIGMLRPQVGWLVVIEGFILALIGAAVGVPLGIVFVKVLTSIPQFAEILVAGVVISWGGIAMGVIGSILTALAASVLPAWSAMRVSPLKAMTPLAAAPRSRVPWRLTLLGLLLIAVDTLMLYGPIERIVPGAWARPVQFYGHFALGTPCLMAGFFLLAPLFVRTVERAIGPLVAAMLGLNLTLLRQQLSAGLWRAAGTCAALMVGLAILVAMNVQGNSFLNGWKLPNQFPDIFITAPILSPLDMAAVRKLATTPGIRADRTMPIAIASPEFSNSIFAMVGAAVMPNATMFFGVDPDMAFELMKLDFREGNAEQAQAMLKKGRHVIVTEEFRQLKGFKVGSTLSLKTPRHGVVDYTVAGVVWSPGIDVIVSMQDMGRQFDQRTAASVFGTLDDAREDFGVERYYLVAANLDYHVQRAKVLWQIEQRLGLAGMNVGDVREIKFSIQRGFHKLLLFASSVAVAAMAVASLGVTNTIMASIRSRRWTFGVLRSIGVTRSQLLRLVLAEAALLGLVGVALGLAAGALISFNAKAVGRIAIGYAPPTDVPWQVVGFGSLAVMVIALLASLWPAWDVARAEPLALLQAGRSAA